MTGKNKYTLPNHIIPFKNPDKCFQEEATSDLLFMPHSSRVILYGGLYNKHIYCGCSRLCRNKLSPNRHEYAVKSFFLS